MYALVATAEDTVHGYVVPAILISCIDSFAGVAEKLEVLV